MTRLQRRLLRWYRSAGRADLPWRTTRDPYFTLVSECMLQQTQVDRVVPAFAAFIERFPTLAALASASTADVLRMWRGLGYNSRAIRLHAVAQAVVRHYRGEMPSDPDALRALPGIGPYTAAAIRAFAFNIDEAPMDTNIKRIVHRLFYGIEYPIRAREPQLAAHAQALVPPGQAHDWNSAMMDLGATLCGARAPKCEACPIAADCAAAPIEAAALESARRAHAKPRAGGTEKFEASARFARGRIVDRLRDLPPGEKISMLDLARDVAGLLPQRSDDEIAALVSALHREGLVSLDQAGVGLRE